MVSERAVKVREEWGWRRAVPRRCDGGAVVRRCDGGVVARHCDGGEALWRRRCGEALWRRCDKEWKGRRERREGKGRREREDWVTETGQGRRERETKWQRVDCARPNVKFQFLKKFLLETESLRLGFQMYIQSYKLDFHVEPRGKNCPVRLHHKIKTEP